MAAFEKTRDVRTGWSEKMLKSLTPVYGSVDNLQAMWSEACDAYPRGSLEHLKDSRHYRKRPETHHTPPETPSTPSRTLPTT